MSVFWRLFHPRMFDGLALLITQITILAWLVDLAFPGSSRIQPLFIVYCYIGLYVFSVCYELYEIAREKRE